MGRWVSGEGDEGMRVCVGEFLGTSVHAKSWIVD